MKKLLTITICTMAAASCIPTSTVDNMTDTNKASHIWPLCGRISESNDTDWHDGDDCPPSRQTNAYNDYPLSSTFGPRQKASENLRYDFHRGIDIPTPINTPLFATADGKVIKAGADPAYADNVILVRHYDPTLDDCDAKACLSSVYLHINSTTIAAGDEVKQGQLIGYSGAASYPHLHFEIRQAPGNHDKYSAWQRDAIHPLGVLSTTDSTADNIHVSIPTSDLSNPLTPKVSVMVSINTQTDSDINRIEIELFTKQDDGALLPIDQIEAISVGNTPENNSYVVNPNFFDMQLFNRQYSYKNSNKFPWSSFTFGGAYQSPFHPSLPASYNPNIHLDHQLQDNITMGEFNGLVIAPERFNNRSENYQLTVTFNSLTGTENAEDLCIVSRAIDARGNFTQDATYNCN